jgi:hypothetical protein
METTKKKMKLLIRVPLRCNTYIICASYVDYPTSTCRLLIMSRQNKIIVHMPEQY